MPEPEQDKGLESRNIVEILALFKLGKIKREDLGEENLAVFNFYLALMSENLEFAEKVRARINELNDFGKKEPLFPQNILDKLKKKRRRSKKREYALQLNFLPVSLTGEKGNYGIDNIRGPEDNIFKPGRKLDSFVGEVRRSVHKMDIQAKRLALREMIGLPVARGKNPYVNDPKYKFLVKKNSCAR